MGQCCMNGSGGTQIEQVSDSTENVASSQVVLLGSQKEVNEPVLQEPKISRKENSLPQSGAKAVCNFLEIEYEPDLDQTLIGKVNDFALAANFSPNTHQMEVFDCNDKRLPFNPNLFTKDSFPLNIVWTPKPKEEVAAMTREEEEAALKKKVKEKALPSWAFDTDDINIIGVDIRKSAWSQPKTPHAFMYGPKQLCKNAEGKSDCKFVFTHNTGYYKGMYGCDKCQKKELVGDHWHCKKHYGDFCTDCEKKTIGKCDAKCRSKWKWTNSNDFYQYWFTCDRCGKEEQTAMHWRCPEHNADYCTTCQPQFEEASQTQESTYQKNLREGV